ncbi:hypothetical protein XcvCFBP7113P_06970 [Xanthomonas citri pv. vignicola]|nr:hypothetical protein XcvCFBP7113P_06970 [Xanthomonas citri pv. vignicola]
MLSLSEQLFEGFLVLSNDARVLGGTVGHDAFARQCRGCLAHVFRGLPGQDHRFGPVAASLGFFGLDFQATVVNPRINSRSGQMLVDRGRGSPPFSRTLTRRPIKAMRSVHVKAQEVHCRVQAWRG